MTRALLSLVLAIVALAGCAQSCGPSVQDVNACASACSNAGGIKEVTFQKCVCHGAARPP